MAEEHEHGPLGGPCEICAKRTEELDAAVKLLVDYAIPPFDPEDPGFEDLMRIGRFMHGHLNGEVTPEEARAAIVRDFLDDMWHWINEWFEYIADMALTASEEEEASRLPPRRGVTDVVDTL